MPSSAQEIVRKQEEVLRAMSRIRTMCRGTVSRQNYPERSKRKDGRGAVGPYCLWQGTIDGKRFGKRISGPEAQCVEKGIAQRHDFEALCEEYVALSCQLEAMQRDASVSEEALKKGLKLRSKGAQK